LNEVENVQRSKGRATLTVHVKLSKKDVPTGSPTNPKAHRAINAKSIAMRRQRSAQFVCPHSTPPTRPPTASNAASRQLPPPVALP
jgi:hypothetical protein